MASPAFAERMDETEKLMNKINEAEHYAVCAVSSYLEAGNVIGDDVKYYLGEFREREMKSKIFPDLVLIRAGVEWVKTNNYMGHMKNAFKICINKEESK